MSSKVRFYSFSVTPEQDTPQVLKDYGKERGFDLSNWMLLTGERDAIFRVGREIFKADRSVGAQKTPDSFIHSDNLYLLDQKLRIRGIYSSGSSKQVEYLAQDIRRLTEAVQ
jgi:protein SCO1/2